MTRKMLEIILVAFATMVLPVFIVSCHRGNSRSGADELPMHSFGISVLEDAVIIHTIADGLDKPMYLLGDPAGLVKFELRNDGWRHVSVRPIGKEGPHQNYDSVVILVPTAEDLKEWRAWFTKAVADAKEKAKQVPQREYPARVLPPK